MSSPPPYRALYAEFTAREGMADAVSAILAELATKVRAEPGNIAFDCYRLEDNPNRFFVHEIYRDEAAFQAHISADYGPPFNARLQTLIVEPHSILTFITPLAGADT